MTRKDGPRILLVDIETFPILMYAWQPWDATALRIVQDTSICSFSVKWLDGKQTTKILPDYKGYKPGSRDDRRLCEDLWGFLNEADIVGAHNLDGFDNKKVVYRLMVNGLGPPAPYQHTDTLKEVRKVAGHDSNKLNELCRVHGLGQKKRTGGKDLWFDCLDGDMAAWERMRRYNAHDTRLLQPWYTFLRPWMLSHPNVALYTDGASCPRCGSKRLRPNGHAYTRGGRYQRFRCEGCGYFPRSTHSEARASLV